MNEDSIFMVNVDQYLLRSRWKRLPKTCLYCLFFHVQVHKFTANAALRVIDLCTQQNSNQANIDRSEFGINRTPSPSPILGEQA